MRAPARSPHSPARAVAPDAAAFARGTGTRNRTTGAPPPMHVVLFGAGHVGHALVTLLGALPCTVQWVDTRDELFPDECPPNVQPEPTDTPEAIVDAAPPGTYFLVMTHNHALDFALAEQIMRRRDFAYFGMIGSRTKRVKFERRLAARGVDPARLVEMVCPIGVAGIVDKAPGSIAVAVCAELLQVRAGMPVAGAKAAAAAAGRDDACCLR
ncbi:xanthine dehydrogenase accessory protein XdhC [Burkholderia multivorans]|uniref:xanthine dehydrogenase accessory protein XdhC n=1 Tax=Burkholderia multivorans TaxID=87883 RepID=UPI0019D1AACB|nr:xanthine dehydrogenase accessory protein XdhC [Burkholderia multivorans]MBN8163027.1 xanthine dehydrogenase accessory protein XdhC [Burkholderia multivorans]MBN8169574.1 xanthine dehydrogenase accessory protein XdhC [Burkholderia multivorans]MBN8173827.1 xanthine dehydrogenase accessory protein XdhC [Burkholderia multivorans]QSL30183.1 xanthine dehydrogenase accessory protein XdhC [Burkholderia multivorans]QSL35923.1 xanthine dehydrogenase accessory protein XdhC [Burkholderia multivorans]